MYIRQLNINSLLKHSETCVSALSTENNLLRCAVENQTKTIQKLQEQVAKLQKTLKGAYDSLTCVTKAIGMLKYSEGDYKARLTEQQGRLIDAIAKYSECWAAYVQEITEPSRNGGKNQYLCNSGTGSQRSGAFTVYPDTNSYHCLACDANGDIFNLYVEMNNITDFKIISEELKVKYNISFSQPIRQKKQIASPQQPE